MKADQEMNTGHDQWTGSSQDNQSDQPDRSTQGSMGSDNSTGAVQQQPSDPTSLDNRQDQYSAPKKDDSPQAAVKTTAEAPGKMASHDMPTSPMSVNKIERNWFKPEDADELRHRWNSIQIQFVDEPCAAVEQGEALVAETAERLKQMLADQQQSIGEHWLNHDDISTEELRTTLLSYRAVLNRILNL